MKKLKSDESVTKLAEIKLDFSTQLISLKYKITFRKNSFIKIMKMIFNSIQTKVKKYIYIYISQRENNESKRTSSITILKNLYRILFAQRIVKIMQRESISMEISWRSLNELIAAKLMHSIVHSFAIATFLIILKAARYAKI